MTDATTHLGLGKPTVGADSDAWGGILNGDLDQLDALWVNLGNNAFGTAAGKATGFFAQSANNLSDLSNASAARTNLGLGSAALQPVGTSGATVPLLSQANTWSLGQTFSGGLTGNVAGNASTASALAPGNQTINGNLAVIASVTAENDVNFGLHTVPGVYIVQMGANAGINYDTTTGRLNIVAGGVTVGYFDSTGYHQVV